MVTSATTAWPDCSALGELSDHQKHQAARATSQKIGLLIGTPGTGKTYTSAAIIKAIVEQHGASQVTVCAPTGKAAVRLTANLSRYGVPLEATTIHRALRVQRSGADKRGWGFEHGPGKRLPTRFLVSDESSMLSTGLANSLLSAVADDANVLLIGDPYQLTPVDTGAPLRDLLQANLAFGELSEVQRNSGMVVAACVEMKLGRRFAALPGLEQIDEKCGKNLVHIEQQRADHAMACLERTITQAAAAGFNPIWDIQVLCAVNGNKSEVARDVLNQRLQSLLNPTGQVAGKSKFRVGDKVICTSNSWMESIVPINSNDTGEIPWQDILENLGSDRRSPAMDNRVFIANGDIGRILSVGEKDATIQFDFPKRTVRCFVAGAAEIDLAYAITTHKSQGSQAPVVITMVDGSFGASMVASREWWYTALSRAERIAITIGQRRVIDKQCQRVALGLRKTFLRQLIGERI